MGTTYEKIFEKLYIKIFGYRKNKQYNHVKNMENTLGIFRQFKYKIYNYIN